MLQKFKLERWKSVRKYAATGSYLNLYLIDWNLLENVLQKFKRESLLDRLKSVRKYAATDSYFKLYLVDKNMLENILQSFILELESLIDPLKSVRKYAGKF